MNNDRRQILRDGRPLQQNVTLRSCNLQQGEVFLVVKNMVAAAFDPREVRLRNERDGLERLNEESENVQVAPINILPGGEPDEFQVTLLCWGIHRLAEDGSPEMGTRHICQIQCDSEFPLSPPKVYFSTPIWHPNVDHATGEVCVNKPEWVGGMSLVDLCRQLFEMVQYRNYHAIWSRPYPMDGEVAKWVRDVAEPKGIVNKDLGIALDDRDFYKPTPVGTKIRVQAAEPKKEPRIKLVNKPNQIRISGSPNESTGT